MARPAPAARPKAARSNLLAELSPRERLLRRGAAALSDAELLSVVLLNGSSEAPALRQAVDLLREVGGFPGLRHLGADSFRGLGSGGRGPLPLSGTSGRYADAATGIVTEKTAPPAGASR